MIKTIASLTSLLFSLGLPAQSNNAKIPSEPIRPSKFSLGVKGGAGHSFIMPYQNYAFQPSWDAGVSAVVSPWAHWGLGLDLHYSAEGARFDYADADVQNRLDYLRLPLKGIYFFRTYEMDFRPKISLGPTFGLLLNDPNTVKAETFDLGGTVTVGFNYRLIRAVWLSVDASYYHGFLDVYTRNPEYERNGHLRLNIGVSFGF